MLNKEIKIIKKIKKIVHKLARQELTFGWPYGMLSLPDGPIIRQTYKQSLKVPITLTQF